MADFEEGQCKGDVDTDKTIMITIREKVYQQKNPKKYLKVIP